MLFLATWLARGVRHGRAHFGVEFHQGFDEARFASPAGGRDHKEVAGEVVHYSMFCTCSRSCSINTFMSTEIRVISIVADLEPKVLASRCSS